MPSCLSIFSGCGGLDYGLKLAGVGIVAFADSDHTCRETILANNPRAKVFGDINEASRYVGHVDIVAGGPPCQSFSDIGKRKFLDDKRGMAIHEFFKSVMVVQPTVFILENVVGITHHPTLVNNLRRRFNRVGYKTSCFILDAYDYGVPQKRKRFFMVGRKWISPIISLFPREERKSLRSAIEDLEDTPGECAVISKSMRRLMNMIPEGGNWRSLPRRYWNLALGSAKTGGRTGYCRRLSYSEPCPTLLCSPTQRATLLYHPTKQRTLSVAEYQRIQGFPDNFKVIGTVSQKYRQLGNAVPISLGQAVGEAIIKMSLTA